MGGSGGGGNSTTVQKADPWSGVQPYLQQLYSHAGDAAQTGGPQVYQGETYAPLTGVQNGAINQALQASGDSGINAQAVANAGDIASQRDSASIHQLQDINGLDPSSQYLKSVLGGTYLNSNPYLTGAMDAANADTTRNFQTAVMPSLASQFSLAGRYGSGAQSQGISDATNNLARQISGTNANIMNVNYQNERGAMGNAASQLAGIRGSALSNFANRQMAILPVQQALTQQGYQNRWNNVQNMAGVGDVLQQNQQGIDTANANLFNANQQRPYQNLSWLNSILNGSMALNGQSSNTQQSSSGGGLRSALGGAGAGAATGAAIGSVVPGIGTAIGAGVGAIGGALMSVL